MNDTRDAGAADSHAVGAVAWADALNAAALAAIDPGIGVWLRAPAGPVREAWLAAHRDALGPGVPLRRVPGHIGDEGLLGGLDLVATLTTSRPVLRCGLLAEADGGVVLLPMAERLDAGVAAKVVAALDAGEVIVERDGVTARTAVRFGVVALDEGEADDERPPSALCDRLGLIIDLHGIAPRQAVAGEPAADDIASARKRLPQVEPISAELLQALCAAGSAFGVASLRATLLALRAARAQAALDSRDRIDAEDVARAVQLLLMPRATRWPEAPAEAEQEAPAQPPASPEPDPADAADRDAPSPPPSSSDEPLDDIVLEAALASLPAELLRRLQSAATMRAAPTRRSAGRAGALGGAAARGRPAGVRRGSPARGLRLDLIETLRAAAAWQRLRGQLAAGGGRSPVVRVQADDFRVVHRRARRETTTLFVVDASGSAALHRLAEAKGAVELLLADCYVRRDRVALIAFRGRGAELLLPPTRSLVRAKRSLAGLPGGGGTPLAAALKASAGVVEAVARRGDSPLVVLLTDGRANVALDGTGGRAQADADALAAAGALRATACPVLLIDTSREANPQARRLADAMRARYLPLPHAGARELSRAVQAMPSGRR